MPTGAPEVSLPQEWSYCNDLPALPWGGLPSSASSPFQGRKIKGFQLCVLFQSSVFLLEAQLAGEGNGLGLGRPFIFSPFAFQVSHFVSQL